MKGYPRIYGRYDGFWWLLLMVSWDLRYVEIKQETRDPTYAALDHVPRNDRLVKQLLLGNQTATIQVMNNAVHSFIHEPPPYYFFLVMLGLPSSKLNSIWHSHQGRGWPCQVAGQSLLEAAKLTSCRLEHVTNWCWKWSQEFWRSAKWHGWPCHWYFFFR